MKDHAVGPTILSADRVDNAVVVEFEGESHPVIYTAYLLHAAKGLARVMHERELETEE